MRQQAAPDLGPGVSGIRHSRRRGSRPALLALLAGAAVLVAACGQGAIEAPTLEPGQQPSASPTEQPAALEPEGAEEVDLSQMRFNPRGWETDFNKRSVPLEEIVGGGPPRDGIPPIDEPRFVGFEEADEWLRDNEPVVAFELGGEARAYPIQILMWHEIVNDEVAGVPVAITFCPLCNTAIAFDRQVEGLGTLRFGTTGNLRHSDLVMWDDQTESWWQQITGEAIVGELTGTTLRLLPASMVSYAAFKEAHPGAVVLSRDTGFSRDYGFNPYVGYDDVDQSPFLFEGPTDGRLPPMERVVAVDLNDMPTAYPFSALQEKRVIMDMVGDEFVAVFWVEGTASALDRSSIPGSRDVGATGVFSPIVGGQRLRFEWRDGAIVDRETESTWNVLGRAVEGSLAGQQLEPIVHGNHFWFAWAVFKPETRIVR